MSKMRFDNETDNEGNVSIVKLGARFFNQNWKIWGGNTVVRTLQYSTVQPIIEKTNNLWYSLFFLFNLFLIS